MSQHDLDIANQGFPATRADINNALQALGSSNSGATAPSTTYANQLWYDTANNILKIRNEDNDAWISLLYLDQTNDAVAQFDVDNIRIDGNTISTTDTNGNITLDPNGTGDVVVGDGGADNRTTFNPSSAFAIGVKNGSNHGGFIGSNGSSGMQFSSSGGAARMTIDSSGRITMPNQPSCLITKQAAVSTNNVVVGGVVQHNVGSHYNTTNGRFTAPIAGYYFVSFGVLTNADESRLELRLRKNGAVILHANESTGTSDYGGAVASGVISLSANDYLDMFMVIGTMYGGHENNFFSVRLLG